METIKKEFEIGDPVVWKHIEGHFGTEGKTYRGRVANIDKFNKNYHVYVDFGDGFHEWFTSDGRWELESEVSLFHAVPFWQAKLSEGRLEARVPGKPGSIVLVVDSSGVYARALDVTGSMHISFFVPFCELNGGI